jgi:DNA-binding NtrC family response regulator
MAEAKERACERVLLADDDALSRDFMSEALGTLGLDVHAVADGDAAVRALADGAHDYVVTDLVMPGCDGLAVLETSKRLDPDRPVILVTAHGTMHVAVEALRRGADDILEKPVSPDDLRVAVHRVRERRKLLRENRYFRAQSVGHELLVRSPAMASVVELVTRVAPSKATVLITGESGTGKERVAALLHMRSDRASGPFVKINCAAIPEALMEAEFFGHEAGAFTGATGRREGRFELADGGTLFLDEVGEMSPMLQAKLLRVLQEGEFSRVGGNRALRVDVRVVAATNRDLARDVASGRFRSDLFYRLNVVPVELPPLRDRVEDVLPLAQSFLPPGIELSGAAARLLESFDWPGNVRELQNVMQRAALLCRGNVIDADLLAPWISPFTPQLPRAVPPVAAAHALVGRPLRAVEEDLIRATLAHCHGNRTRAAEMLGISVRTLFNKLRVVGGEKRGA